MLVLPTSHYTRLGEMIIYLMTAQKGWPVHGPDHVLENISTLCNLVNELKLPRTHAQLAELRSYADDMASDWRRKTLGESDAKLLVSIVARLRETLMSESQEQLACVLIDNRFGARKLLSDVRYLMTPRVYDLLPTQVRRDLSDAGRCIAFELGASAGFHLARALEGLVNFYYAEAAGGTAGRLNDSKWGLTAEDLIPSIAGAPREVTEKLGDVLKRVGDPSRSLQTETTLEMAREMFAEVIEAAMLVIDDLAARGTPPVSAGAT